MAHDVVGALEDLVDQQTALVQRKAELREDKDGNYRRKYAALQERMKELDQSALKHRTARHGILLRVAELQGGEEVFKLQQVEHEREAWEVERGLQLDKVARKMMDMHPVEEQRRKLEDEQRLRLRRLDAIQQEKVRRRRDKERRLEEAFRRAKHLQEHAGEGLSDPISSVLAAGEAVSEDDDDVEDEASLSNGNRRRPHRGRCSGGLAKVAAEIDIARRRAAHNSVREHEAIRRKLNEQRQLLTAAADSAEVKMQQTRAAQAGGLKALAREELGPAAFQILETPAPPEVTSTWASTLAARAVAKTESSMRKLPKEKRRDYEGLSGDTFEQEGVFNSGGKSKMFRGRRGSEAGKEEKKGGADAVTVAAAAGESGRSWDEEERQRWEEARQDARRSAAVDAFLRASSASEGGGGGGGSGTRRKRRGRGRTGAQPAVLRSEEREDRNHRSAVFTPRRVAGGGAGGDEEGDGGDGGRPPLRQSPRSLRSTSSLSEEEQKEVDDGESSEGKSAEEEGGVRDGAVLALDMEGLVADLRAQEGEAVARIEALRSQASALAEEEEWLATGSLGKGHAWEALSQTTYSSLRGGGAAGGADIHSLAVETDRLNLEVANRAMEEEARLARKETDLLLTAAAILDEHISVEIEAVHAHLTSASAVALGVVGTALASSTFAAASAARSYATGGGGSVGDASSPATLAAQSQHSGPVLDLLFSTFRELLLSKYTPTSPSKGTTKGGETIAGMLGATRGNLPSSPMITDGSSRSVSGREGAEKFSPPDVLRLTDIQPYRPLRHEDLPKYEQLYFDQTSTERFSVSVPKGDGLVTAIAMGPATTIPVGATGDDYATARAGGAAETTSAPSGAAGAAGTFLLAAGTNKGGIAVWAIPCREEETNAGSSVSGAKTGGTKSGKEVAKPSAAVLVRVASSASMPKDERCPVKRVHFGTDGRSQLVSLDAQDIVKVWDVGAGRDAVAAVQGTNARGGVGGGTKTAVRDFLPELRGVGGGGGGGNGGNKFQALALVARWTIRKTDLERPLLDRGTATWLKNAGTSFAAEPKKTEKNKMSSDEGAMGRGREGGSSAHAGKRPPSPSGGGGRAGHGGDADGSWPASTKRDVRATAVAFHPAMTAFGHQHSVVIGTAGGSVVKCNADAWSAASGGDGGPDGNAGAEVVYGRCTVPLEPGDRGAPYEATVLKPDTSDTGEGESGGNASGGGRNTVRREFFERHRHPVVFIGFQDRASLTMVTLDASGLLCVWPYGPDAFSGFGWYTPSKEVLVDTTLHRYTLEAIKTARRAGRSDGGGGGGGGGRPAYIFNRALPPASSETADTEVALDEVTAGGGYRLWSIVPTPSNGRAKTYVAIPDGRGDGGGGRRKSDACSPTIVARFDEDGELRSAARFNAFKTAREGRIMDAKLTTSGGELAVIASYRPLAGGSGAGADGGGGIAALQSTVMVFLVDLQSLNLLQQHVRHDWLGVNNTGNFPSPMFAVSPVLDATGSDYVYLTIGDSIRIFSLETGSEVTTEGRKRLSTDIHGGGDTIRGGDAAAAAAAAAATPAAIAAGASTLVVAAEVTSDNGLLAIACADSGAVHLFQLRDNSMETSSNLKNDRGSTGLPWRKLLRSFACDRRDATPWEMRARLTTSFPGDVFESLGHRGQIRSVIVGEIVEAAMALSDERTKGANNSVMAPLVETGDSPLASQALIAGGRVSLRALLGKPPYGTV